MERQHKTVTTLHIVKCPIMSQPNQALWDITRLLGHTHLGHYETLLYGLVGTIWDITRLFPGSSANFFVEDGFLSTPVLTPVLVLLSFGKICLRGASRPVPPPPGC